MRRLNLFAYVRVVILSSLDVWHHLKFDCVRLYVFLRVLATASTKDRVKIVRLSITTLYIIGQATNPI